MKATTTALLATILILGASAFGIAAELDVSTLPMDLGPLPVSPGDVLKLDLTSAYELALARNLNVHVGRYDIAIADANVATRRRGAPG